VVPSLFESSSYPVIEAQTLGVPAMCSAITSLPELIEANAGLLFDPHSPDDIARQMLRWLKDPADRQAYAESGRVRATREHSLQAYASRMRDLYAGITGSDLDV
jgi:alpha-1,3-rhamnosyl/mannosyltransferase